jgi:hypothetical protein
MKTFRVRTGASGVFAIEAESFRQVGEYVSFYVGTACVALVRVDAGGYVADAKAAKSA